MPVSREEQDHIMNEAVDEYIDEWLTALISAQPLEDQEKRGPSTEPRPGAATTLAGPLLYGCSAGL